MTRDITLPLAEDERVLLRVSLSAYRDEIIERQADLRNRSDAISLDIKNMLAANLQRANDLADYLDHFKKEI